LLPCNWINQSYGTIAVFYDNLFYERCTKNVYAYLSDENLAGFSRFWSVFYLLKYSFFSV